MQFNTSQHMRMSQQMKLAPHMIQSMEILQMGLAELEERIEQELESNATLELAEGDVSQDAPDPDAAQGERTRAESGPLEMDERSGKDDFERLESFERDNPDVSANEFDGERVREREDYEPRATGDGDSKLEAMANTASRPESFLEQLAEQWMLVEVDPVLRPLGEHLIGFIEDDGYIRTPMEQIAERYTAPGGQPAPDAGAWERALRAVQLMLEPAGIGARTQRECLLLQIDAKEDEGDVAGWEVVRTLVEQHLEDLAQNRLPKVAQKMGLSIEDLHAALERLRTLSLAPARRLVSASEPGITPDAFVEHDPENDRYYAYLNDRRLPNLRINQEYAKLAKDKQAPKPTRDFIKVNLGNAQFLIDAIEQRKRTILRVIEAVVGAQREFFDYGPQAIKPLPMTKVAEQLGVHVATVSRAVADKYIQTPRGIVALRKFFTGGTTTESGEEVAWDAIKNALQEVIDAEDKKNPLSDDQLADALKAKGLEIARRTVAKYRGQLNIPTGRLRKVHE